MGLTLGQTVLWYSTFGLEVVLCIYAARRRLYAHLPIFTAYLGLLILRAAFIYVAYTFVGYRSRFAFYSYWISEGVLLAARGASIGELIWKACRWYAGLRSILRWVLAVISALLLTQALLTAVARSQGIPPFVLTLEQSLEFTAALALMVLLAFSRFYDVPLQRMQTLLTSGLLFYSLVQVANNAISKHGMESHFHWWEGVRSTSFCVALTIWLIALVKPPTSDAGDAVQVPHDLQATRSLMRRGPRLLRGLYDRLHRVDR